MKKNIVPVVLAVAFVAWFASDVYFAPQTTAYKLKSVVAAKMIEWEVKDLYFDQGRTVDEINNGFLSRPIIRLGVVFNGSIGTTKVYGVEDYQYADLLLGVYPTWEDLLNSKDTWRPPEGRHDIVRGHVRAPLTWVYSYHFDERPLS